MYILTLGGVIKSLEGPTSEIKGLDYAPSGTLLAASSRDKSVWVWDTLSYDPVAVLQGHGGDVKCCLFLSETRIVSGGYDGGLFVWEEDDEGDWSLASRLASSRGGAEDEEGEDTVWSISKSTSSHRVAVGRGSGRVEVYDGLAYVSTIPASSGGGLGGGTTPRYGVDVSPVESGHQCLLASEGSAVKVYRDATAWGDEKVAYEEVCGVEAADYGDVNDVRWIGGGRRVAAVGDDGRLRVWEFRIG